MGVCLAGGIRCLPNYSKMGKKLCLPPDVRCNGEDDCVDGMDEESCPIFLSAGVQALIAIAVIAVVVSVPVIYVILRRRQGRPIIPPPMQPLWDRITPCCPKSKDRSSQQLAESGNRMNDSRSPVSADKVGLTNVGFETNPSPTNPTQQYSVTGRPLNKFKQAVNASELERVPSYRDWQANRLQQPKQTSKESPKIPKEHNQRHEYNQVRHTAEVNSSASQPTTRMQPHGVVDNRPITYAPSAYRPTSAAANHHKPYAIASPDGRSNYEARTHLQGGEGPRTTSTNPDGARPRHAQWEHHVAPNPNSYKIGATSHAAPPNYETYASVSTAVPPSQLREALEKVAVSTPHHGPGGYQRGADHYSNSADTVV